MTVPTEAVTAAANVLMEEIWADDRFEPDHAAIAELVLQAAAPLIAAAERNRIRQLALEHSTSGLRCSAGDAPRPSEPCACRDSANARFPFANLLRDEP